MIAMIKCVYYFISLKLKRKYVSYVSDTTLVFNDSRHHVLHVFVKCKICVLFETQKMFFSSKLFDARYNKISCFLKNTLTTRRGLSSLFFFK